MNLDGHTKKLRLHLRRSSDEEGNILSVHDKDVVDGSFIVSCIDFNDRMAIM